MCWQLGANVSRSLCGFWGIGGWPGDVPDCASAPRLLPKPELRNNRHVMGHAVPPKDQY